MKIDDVLLDKLAEYFIYQDLLNTRGWTFESFVDKYLRGVEVNGW